MRRVGPLVVWLVVFGGAPALALPTHLDNALSCDIHVGLTEHARVGGALPIVIEFENAGAARTIRVRTIRTPSVSESFHLPANRATRGCLYLPGSVDFPYFDYEIQFVDEGRGRVLKTVDVTSQVRNVEWLSRESSHYRTSSDPELAGVLISAGTAPAVSEDLFKPYQLHIGRVPLRALPDHWVGYSGADLVVIEYDAWARGDAVRDPLIQWTTMGGICLVVDAPERARSEIAAALSAKAPLVRQEAPDRIRAGLGNVVFVSREFLTAAHPDFLDKRGLAPALRARQRYRRSESIPKFEAVGQPPFWPLLGLLMVFAGTIGPLGWWYLVRKKGRLLTYFVAAPAVSVCVVLLTIVVSVVHEGFRPYLRCVGVRLLDQRVKARIDVSQFGVYAPFTFAALEGDPGELPHFFREEEEYGESRSLGNLVLRPAGAKRRYGGMLPIRRMAWYGREQLARERRRLVVWEDEGKILVENHLGCGLEDLLVRHEGTCAALRRLDEGEQAAAEPLSREEFARRVKARRKQWGKLAQGSLLGKAHALGVGRWTAAMLDFSDGAPQGAYAAQANGAVPEHVWLESFRDEGSTCMVLGVY